ASWIADAGSCDKPLVTSWFPVLYAWYAPMSSGAAGSMNDAARFVRTLSQHAVQPTPGAEGLARYACTRAASARLTLRNVAGVLKPTKPGPGWKGEGVAGWCLDRVQAIVEEMGYYLVDVCRVEHEECGQSVYVNLADVVICVRAM